jgi:tight adherence protein B
MVAPLGSRWGVALGMFAVIALSFVSVALLLEWWSAFSRRRDITKSFRALTVKGPDESGTDQSILREQRKVTGLDALLMLLPRGQDLSRLLEQTNMKWSPQFYLGLSLGLALGIGVAVNILTRNLIPTLLFGLIAGFVPTMLLFRSRRKRLDLIEEQLPEAVDLLGRAIRAGHPLTMGLRMVADEGPSPIAGYFQQASEEQRFGMPFDDSLLGMVDRIPLVDMRILVTAIMVQREVGGNLAEILDNIAQTVRARFTLRRQLRVYTAQGRMSGYILAVLPPILGGIIYFLDPTYITLLFTEPMGRVMLVAAIVLQTAGFLWIRRIVQIEV